MWRLVFALSLPLAASSFAHTDPVANPGAAYAREAPATHLAEPARPVDPQKAATAEVVVRDTRPQRRRFRKRRLADIHSDRLRGLQDAAGRENRDRSEAHREDRQGVQGGGDVVLGVRSGPEALSIARSAGQAGISHESK